MLIDLIRTAAATNPDRPVVIDAERSLTYADCLSRSEELAAGLLYRSISRAGVAVGDVGELIALLCGSSRVGSELCIYDERPDREDILQRAAELGHDIILSDRPLDLGGAVEVIQVTDLAAERAGPPESSGEAQVLILTTGTTSRPKAARYDWAKLVSAIVSRADSDDAARWLLAYNLRQFGGLQVVIHVLAGQGTLVVPRTRQPHDAIAAMRQHDVSHVSATPTFWRLVTGAISEEEAARLPLRQITLGGEIVSSELLERLRRLFPAARISQVYGSTEVGTAIAVTDGRSGLPLSVLERGEEAAVQLRIVDGELQARSQVGMLGYHAQPPDEEEWRRTGDLVEVRGDRIHFVGRTTDVINVGGIKVHPGVVEEAVGGVVGVRLARAYGRQNPITGEIVALEVVPEPGAEPERVEAAIRSACAKLPRPAQPRLIRFVSSLATAGDKISRRVPSVS